MEATTRDYILFLLKYVKQIYGENLALKSLFMTHPDPQVRLSSRVRLQELLDDPEAKHELDAKFDPPIEKIMQTLDDREAFAALLRIPTKGLPN